MRSRQPVGEESLRKGILTLEKALALMTEAESLLADNEYEMRSLEVIRLTGECTCSAYDCEFVVLARSLNTKLITMARRILQDFPGIAMSLPLFLA